MEFGKKLKELRKKMNLTQSDVVRLIGIDPNKGKEYLSLRGYMAYEQNNARPRRREIYERLADVFSCNINYLLTDDSNKSFMSNSDVAFGMINRIMPNVNFIKRIIIRYDLKHKGRLYDIWAGVESDNIKKEHTIRYINGINVKYDFFSAVAFEILLQDNMSNGINFIIGKKNEKSSDVATPDDILVLNSGDIYENWIYYFPANLLQIKIKNYKDIVEEYIKQLVLLEINKNRKYVIVTDDTSFYEYFVSQKKCYSLCANVDIVKVDIDKSCISAESELFSINGTFNK